MTENLTRVPAKIFAENAPQNVVGQFGSALNGTKVNTTDVNIIQGLPAYTTGWSSAVISNRNYPTLEEMNGVMKTMSYQTAYNMQKGVAEWDSQTTYYTGDICKAVGNGVLYVSRADNNIGNPVSNTTYWQEYQGAQTSIPATNYIYSMDGNATYNNLSVTLPDMTLYIADGRSGNNSVNNDVVNVTSDTYTVSGNGEYTLFYNNTTQDLHLAPEYTVRVNDFPEGANYNDVCYKLDNRMYVVESINPNYSESAGVTVSNAGVVSGLGSLSLIFNGSIPLQPVLNLDFTTGADVTTTQDLFTTPYAVGKISNGVFTTDLYSLAYSVDYYPQVYSGAYTLESQAVTYKYSINGTTYYTNSSIQVGSNLYTEESLTTLYGTVTNLQNNTITVSDIQTAYSGSFTQVSSGSYYTCDLGGTNYYTLVPIASGVVVYTDTDTTDVFGTVTSVTGSTVLIQNTTQLYSGTYDDVTTSVYTYLLTSGSVYIYSAGVLIPGLTVYSDNTLTTAYGVVETITTSNVVIHSQNDSAGYVAQAGSGSVASGISIYSDVNLQTLVATSTGANSTYTGSSAKSKVGTINYNVSANTQYSGSLEYNGTSYNLILNGVSSSFITSRNPYVDSQPAISFGGANGFDGTIDINNTNMPNVWTWNGHNTTTPDWNVEPLCELGKITIENGTISDLKINYPIELVKFSDLEHLNLPQGGGGSGYQMFDIVMKDHVLSYAETLGLAPLGTYVYKEAIAGTRYGYPDFYAKCVNEYNDASAIIVDEYLSSNISPIGSLVDNAGVISGFNSSSWAVLPNAFSPNSNNWELVLKIKTGTIGTEQFLINCTPEGRHAIGLYIYTDGKLTFESYVNNTTTVLLRISGTTALIADTDYFVKIEYDSSNGYTLSLSTDGTTYTTEATSAITTPITSGQKLVLGVDSVEGGGYYNFAFTGTINLNNSYINIDDSNWWSGTNRLNYTYNEASNKHRFYDIADKATFDNMYAITGEAWYYGIDTTNERIFLPRSTRFKNGTTSDVGEYQGAGLPPITASPTGIWRRTNANMPTFAEGATTIVQDTIHDYIAGTGATAEAVWVASFDASRSSQIYGSSNTVEYSSTKLIPYMVVGNTANESSAIDVVDVTTTENDTLPLFTGIYFDYDPNNVSWVIAGGQVVSGTIYEFAYNELVNELTTPKYNLNVIEVDNMVVGTDYSTYWKVDQTNQTFTCPTKLSYGALTGGVKGNGKALGLVNSDYTDCVLFSQPNDYNRCTNGIPNGQAAPIDMTNNETSNWTGIGGIKGIAIDDAKSGIVATESTTAKLYFKVANAVQNLELLDAGAVLTAVNNVSAKVDNTIHIIETYENGSSGYIVYSNGLCEQWGIRASGAGVQTLFIKTYKDKNYNLLCEPVGQSGQVQNARPMEYNKQPDGFYSYYSDTYYSINWRTCGYLAEGQY